MKREAILWDLLIEREKMNGQSPHEQSLMDKIRSLPPERIAEVEDFVDFLHQREIMSAKTDPNWSTEMREVVSELRQGAKDCRDEEIEDIVSEAVAAVRKKDQGKTLKPKPRAVVDTNLFVSGIFASSSPVAKLSETDRLTADPTNNKFLACALEGKADYIVSADSHLRALKHFHRIQIVDAATFVILTWSSISNCNM